MTTVDDLVQATRRELNGMQRPTYNQLDGAISDSDASIVLTQDTRAISEGSYLSIGDEIVYVFSIAAQDVAVMRGMLGTTAVSHADLALVEVNPRFPDFSIKDALKKEINSLSPRLFAVDSVTVPMISGRTDAELAIPDEWLEILSIVRGPRPNEGRFIDIAGEGKRGLPTSVYSSGSALFLTNAAESAIDVVVHYALPFDVTTFTDATTLADIGMSESMADIPPLGAVWRLVAGREIKRNFTESQADPRNAAEVPAGAIANSARVMKALRDERVREEMMNIRARWPMRRR